MKTSYEEIYAKLKNQFKVEHKTGYVDDDFIRDIITWRVTVRHGKFMYMNAMKLAEALLEDIEDLRTTMGWMAYRLELECSKKIWRINQKRIKHGLESWFV